jgi:hypothetical protein
MPRMLAWIGILNFSPQESSGPNCVLPLNACAFPFHPSLCGLLVRALLIAQCMLFAGGVQTTSW